jgi:hypothetical protein
VRRLSPIIWARLTRIVHEFNSVIQEFCAAFENPEIQNLAHIIQYNKDHAELAMPERKPSGGFMNVDE